MANSVNHDQTAPEGNVCSGFTQFSQAYLYKYLGKYGNWSDFEMQKFVKWYVSLENQISLN